MLPSTPPDPNLELYQTIQKYISRHDTARRLLQFRIDPDDAKHDLWMRLQKYTANSTRRNMDALVNAWAPKIVDRCIDRERRHFEKRDHREVR